MSHKDEVWVLGCGCGAQGKWALCGMVEKTQQARILAPPSLVKSYSLYLFGTQFPYLYNEGIEPESF